MKLAKWAASTVFVCISAVAALQADNNDTYVVALSEDGKGVIAAMEARGWLAPDQPGAVSPGPIAEAA